LQTAELRSPFRHLLISFGDAGRLQHRDWERDSQAELGNSQCRVQAQTKRIVHQVLPRFRNPGIRTPPGGLS
jgi:hypothetical protein